MRRANAPTAAAIAAAPTSRTPTPNAASTSSGSGGAASAQPSDLPKANTYPATTASAPARAPCRSPPAGGGGQLLTPPAPCRLTWPPLFFCGGAAARATRLLPLVGGA